MCIRDRNILGYYLLFFVFGVFLYQRNVTMRRWWVIALPVALLLVFPAGVFFMLQAVKEGRGTWAWMATSALQAAYAWLMCFGMIGLFRWLASGGSGSGCAMCRMPPTGSISGIFRW